MTPFSRYIFVKTDMSGVEQADLSNREYSPDSYLFMLQSKALMMLGEMFVFYCKCGVHIHCYM